MKSFLNYVTFCSVLLSVAAAGQMDKGPRHREHRNPVALGGDEQLLKRGFRTTPPKADQDTPRGVEDAPAVWVESDLGGNPVCRHAFPIYRAPCTGSGARVPLSIILCRAALGQTIGRIGMQL